MPNTNLSLR